MLKSLAPVGCARCISWNNSTSLTDLKKKREILCYLMEMSDWYSRQTVNICKKQCASSTNQVALNRVAYSACLSVEVPSNCFPQAHFGLKQLCKYTFGQPHLTTHCISLQRSQSVHGVVFFCRKVTKIPPKVYGNYALTFESDYNLNHWLVLWIVLKSTLIQK